MPRSILTGTRTAQSNPTPSGIAQGSPGGRLGGVDARLSGSMGNEVYLWIMLALEMAALGFLRVHFRVHHGG